MSRQLLVISGCAKILKKNLQNFHFWVLIDIGVINGADSEFPGHFTVKLL